MSATASAIKAGAAFIELFADDSKLNKTLASALRKVKLWGVSVGLAGAAVGAVGAAITTPFFAAARAFADAGSALNDMSTRTGVSVEALSALSFAAQQTGTDMGEVEGAVRRLQRLITAGRLGIPAAQSAFAELGLSLEQLARLRPEDQFTVIAARVRAIQDPTARAGAAMLLFGRSGSALLPMIAELDTLTAQARDLGLVMSTQDAQAADRLGDALDVVTAVTRSLWNAVGVALVPTLVDAAEWITTVVKRARDWVRANQPLIQAVFKVGAAMVAAGAAMAAAGATLTGLGVALAAILNPVTLVVGALAGLAYWFVTSTAAGGAALGWLGERFAELKEDALAAFGGITDAIAAGEWGLAAEIAWAFVKVEFLKGFNFLKEVAGGWALAGINAFEHWRYGVLHVAADLWAQLQLGFLDLVDFLSGTWSDWGKFFRDMASSAAGYVLSVLGELAGHVKEILAAALAGGDVKALLGKILAGAARAAETAAAAAEAAVGAGRGRRLKTRDEIEAERKASNDDLSAREVAEREARQRALDAMTAGDADALAQAQAELQRLNEEAADLGLGSAKPGKKETPFSPEDIGAGIEQAAAKVDVKGTFSAAAARGLGAGDSVADDQLKEAKKQTKLLEKIDRKADAGALLFGN